MEDVSDQKKLYELWWKYLQQSDPYKKWLETYAKKYEDWFAWWGLHSNAKGNEKQKHALESKRFNPKWTTLYDLMGRVNIHTISFDEWWERKKGRLDNIASIDHYVNWAGYEINHCWINMKKRPSDPEEFKKQFLKEFIERMKKSPDLYLIVNPAEDLKTLKAGFLTMVNQKRKENQDFYRMIREFRLPIAGKIHIDDLEKYLEVFILKKKKTWNEIILPKLANYKSDYQEVLRMHKRHLQKAKAIIRNVENGKFPGDY